MTLRYKILPEDRRGQLRKLLACQTGLRIIEVHNGLSAIVASTTVLNRDQKNANFDGLWISSLTSSAAHGLPDCELCSIERRLEVIEEVANVTNRFMIVDYDTGGTSTNFVYICNRLEVMGVSAIVIEDQKYPKRNSLFEKGTYCLEDPYVFAEKITCGKNTLLSQDFMIFARIESFIANESIEDALTRARIYLRAGADGIMIHSKKQTADEIYSFLEGYNHLSAELGFRKSVICVPTTYNIVTDQELFQHGADIVIHANHLLRAAQRAMQEACKTILLYDRNFEVESFCVSVPELFDTVGFDDA
jgi:phosphoenolpyruvate phosphomutase